MWWSERRLSRKWKSRLRVLYLKQSNAMFYRISIFSVFCMHYASLTNSLSLSLALLLSFKSATLCFWNSTGLLFYVLAAALVHPRPGLQQQSSGSCLSCCSLCTGNWWWLEWLMTEHKHAVEAKYFCAVAVNCRPSYLSFLLRLRQSCPDEPLKHRNIGKIPQQLSQTL